jgi:hypothetical protein
VFLADFPIGCQHIFGIYLGLDSTVLPAVRQLELTSEQAIEDAGRREVK